MSIDKKIRYKGQSLLDWYQLFIPIVNKYQKAAGKQNLDAAEQKTLWKDHFVKQVNLAELVLIISVRAIHLTDQEVRSIIKFNEADFNDATLLKLLSKLNSSFEKYEPDKAVMTYLHQHSKTLGFELDFRNPKEQTNERESRPKDRKTRTPSLASNKRTRLGDNKSSRFPNTRHKNGTNQNTKTATAATVPKKYQCRRASCKQRGTNTNHAHNKCRFKDDVEPSKTYPNLGTAPLKQDQRTNKILRKNEVVHQSYQHAPIKILQKLFRKMVQQHHQQHSQTQERVIYVRPKGTLLRIVPKRQPINKMRKSS